MAASAATSTTLAVTSKGLSVSSIDAPALVTLTATVETGGKPLTIGQVNFCDATAKLCSDIHLLGTVPLNTSGKAALTFVPRVGAHSYKAEFISTVNDNASVSSAEPLTVYGITKTAIAASGSAGNYTLKATITGEASDVAPAGSVEFRDTSDSNLVLATETLGAGILSSTWVNTQNPATKPQPLSIAVADFNGDGFPDLAVGTNGTTGYLSILIGNGNGTFQAAKTYTGLPNNQAIIAAPFVNDGPLDILTVSNNASGTNNAALFIGDGKGGGTLQTPFSLGGLASVTGLAAGDFNRDGNEDFVITGIIYGVYCFTPLLGNGNGTFGGPTLNAVGSDPLSIVVGPFNTNGYPDIVVADSGAGNVTVFQNNSQGYFFPGSVSYNVGSKPIAMTTGDFNGDGFLDLAVANNGSNNVSIFFGKGNDTLTAGPQSPATGHAPTSIAVGDFNEDGIADLAVVNSGDKTVSILVGKGNGTFTTAPTVPTGINPVNVVTGDFSGSGLTGLAVTNQDIASKTGSTLTVEAAELTQTATATATGISPSGTGPHLVDASYEGDSIYNTSSSPTVSLTGLAAAATPTLTPAAGTYALAQKVTITDTTKGAVIYFTTDGTTPTTGSAKYTAAIAVNASETIQAIAVASGFGESKVATAKYVIGAALPVFTPAAGTYSSAQKVTITDATKGAMIYYTTNDATPTTSSTKYTGPITVSATETIKAIAAASGYANSGVSTATYTIE
jgi:hypothetical protein